MVLNLTQYSSVSVEIKSGNPDGSENSYLFVHQYFAIVSISLVICFFIGPAGDESCNCLWLSKICGF